MWWIFSKNILRILHDVKNISKNKNGKSSHNPKCNVLPVQDHVPRFLVHNFLNWRSCLFRLHQMISTDFQIDNSTQATNQKEICNQVIVVVSIKRKNQNSWHSFENLKHNRNHQISTRILNSIINLTFKTNNENCYECHDQHRIVT